MTAARRVAIGQPQAGLLLSDPSSRGLLPASGAGKQHVAVCAAADDKSGLDRPQRLTGYESRPGRSVGRRHRGVGFPFLALASPFLAL